MIEQKQFATSPKLKNVKASIMFIREERGIRDPGAGFLLPTSKNDPDM